MKKKGEKFLFDMNVFDDGVENGYGDHAPPPVFTEQQLEQARKKAFEDGKAQGYKESEASQTQLIASTLQRIELSAKALFDTEAMREKTYEAESVRLALEIFERLFPFYLETAGFEDLKGAITDIIKKQEGAAKLVIHVAPEAHNDISAHISGLQSATGETKFLVEKDPAIPLGACKISWSDGGAIRDPHAMADQIKSVLQHMLAGKGARGHDER